MKRRVGYALCFAAFVLIVGGLFWGSSAQQRRPVKDAAVIQTAAGSIGPHGETLDALLAHGADPNARDWQYETGSPPSTLANPFTNPLLWWRLCRGGMYECDTALIVATKSGPIGAVKTLLSRGAAVNAEGTFGLTALHYAAIHRNQEKAKLLIAAGADVNARSRSGTTVLRMAEIYKSTAIIALLKAAGAKSN